MSCLCTVKEGIVPETLTFLRADPPHPASTSQRKNEPTDQDFPPYHTKVHLRQSLCSTFFIIRYDENDDEGQGHEINIVAVQP